MAKSERQKAVEKADRAFSLYIRARDGASVLSGREENLNCGHLFTRARYSTRWDEGNAFAQTAGENMVHEHDPWPFYKFFIETYGQAKFDELYSKHHRPRRFITFELLQIASYYNTKLHCLELGCEPTCPIEGLSTEL